ncbi:MAG: threonine ammonia-lyase [Bacteriovoracia bacterium]
MSAKSFRVSLGDIQSARSLLRDILKPTPLIYNPWLSELFRAEIYLKLETAQPIGSFKIRGALNRLSMMSKAERKAGVVASSAGNHAQGVAWAARHFGVNALIVMPKTASIMKVQNTQALGAEIRLEGNSFEEAFAAAKEIQRKSGRIFVHAYEDTAIIAGQGTVGLEILDQLPDVDVVIGSMGGGGMMAGVATALKALSPRVKIIGCQSSGAPALVQSLKTHRPVKYDQISTFADGIAVKGASPVMRGVLEDVIDQVFTADDEEIAEAVLMLIEKAKIVVEGSGAVPLAVARKLEKKIRGKKVVLVVSGGNIDVNLLSRIIDRGLTRTGRRVRLNIGISDRPGSLNRVTQIIAEQGASILQAIHDRNEPYTKIDETEVALTLETRGREHSEKVIAALRKYCERLDVVH